MKLDFNENQYDMYDPYNQRVMIQPWFWRWLFPPQFFPPGPPRPPQPPRPPRPPGPPGSPRPPYPKEYM